MHWSQNASFTVSGYSRSDGPMSKLVSAVIPTYRRPEMAQEAIRNVIDQSYRPLQLIVVDDNGVGHTDQKRTAELVDSLRSVAEDVGIALRYEVMERNLGAAAARNRGADLSEGEYLTFLDDDDSWRPERIAVLARELDANDAASFAYSAVEVHDRESGAVTYILPKEAHGIAKRLLAHNEIGTTSCALIRKRIFDQVGGFDEQLPSRQDVDLWIRLARAGEVRAVSSPLAVHNKHTDRITGRFEPKIEGRLRFLEKYRKDYDGNRRAYAKFAMDTARIYGKHGRWRDAREWYWRSARYGGGPIAIYRSMWAAVETIRSRNSRPKESSRGAK